MSFIKEFWIICINYPYFIYVLSLTHWRPYYSAIIGLEDTSDARSKNFPLFFLLQKKKNFPFISSRPEQGHFRKKKMSTWLRIPSPPMRAQSHYRTTDQAKIHPIRNIHRRYLPLPARDHFAAFIYTLHSFLKTKREKIKNRKKKKKRTVRRGKYGGFLNFCFSSKFPLFLVVFFVSSGKFLNFPLRRGILRILVCLLKNFLPVFPFSWRGSFLEGIGERQWRRAWPCRGKNRRSNSERTETITSRKIVSEPP